MFIKWNIPTTWLRRPLNNQIDLQLSCDTGKMNDSHREVSQMAYTVLPRIIKLFLALTSSKTWGQVELGKPSPVLASIRNVALLQNNSTVLFCFFFISNLNYSHPSIISFIGSALRLASQFYQCNCQHTITVPFLPACSVTSIQAKVPREVLVNEDFFSIQLGSDYSEAYLVGKRHWL